MFVFAHCKLLKIVFFPLKFAENLPSVFQKHQEFLITDSRPRHLMIRGTDLTKPDLVPITAGHLLIGQIPGYKSTSEVHTVYVQ